MLPGNYPSGRGGQLDLHSTTVDGVGVSRVGLVPHFRQASAQAGRMEAGSPVPSGPAGEKAAPPSPAYRAPDAPTDNAAPPPPMPPLSPVPLPAAAPPAPIGPRPPTSPAAGPNPTT